MHVGVEVFVADANGASARADAKMLQLSLGTKFIDGALAHGQTFGCQLDREKSH